MFALHAPRLPRWLRRLSWFLAGAVLAGWLLGVRSPRSSDSARHRPDAARIAAERAEAARRYQALDCQPAPSLTDLSRLADDPARGPRVRGLPAPERLQRGVRAVRRGLAIARCRPSLVAVAMGSTLIREGVDLAMTALSDVSAADRAAAAASLAASAGPMLQPDQIIRAEADHMLLDPRTTDAGAVLDQRDRALRACGPGVTLPRCATLLRADLPVYDVTLHRYLEARSAIFHLGRALHTPG